MANFTQCLAGLLLFSASALFAKDTPTHVVATTKVATSQISDVYLLPTRAISKMQATILAPVEGLIVEITRNIGERVGTGATILQIKNTDPVYEFVAVPVTSSVNGVVSSLDVSVGSKVSKGQLIGQITDPLRLTLTSEIPATEIGKFRHGLEGEFQLSGSKTTIPVVVNAISPLVDPATGTVTMELKPVKSSASIPLGVIGKIKFSLDSRSSIEIPQEALVYRSKKTFVRTVKGNKAKIIPVEIGETKRGKTEITSGLKPGDIVIVRASAFVDDGQTVVVQNSEVAKK